MMKEEKKTTVPPYLSVTKLAKLVDIISTRNLWQVTPAHFTAQNFSKPDAYLALGTLRFLGLIDDSGNATSSLRNFQFTGEKRQKGVEEVVRSSYSKLFDTFIGNKPFDAGESELINDFMVQFDMSKRTAGPAARAFLWLCEQAGLKEATIKIQQREKKDNTNKRGKQAQQDRSLQDEGDNSHDQNTMKIPAPINLTGTHTFTDSGVGWKLQIASNTPLSSEVKRSLVDISEKLDMINKPLAE